MKILLFLLVVIGAIAWYTYPGRLEFHQIYIEKTNPALPFYTKSHSQFYAGVDHWASFGMKSEVLIARLKKEGYRCQLSPSGEIAQTEQTGKKEGATGNDSLTGLHELDCQKNLDFPIARSLHILAQIDYGMRGRLHALRAASVVRAGQSSLQNRFAIYLRKWKWLEEESLIVKGAQYSSAAILGNAIVDSISINGWREQCGEDDSSMRCQLEKNKRFENGYPVLSHAPIEIDEVQRIQLAMEKMRFMPRFRRGMDQQPEESLLLRVEAGKMLLDFSSQDLSGRLLHASFEIQAEGGSATTLHVQVGDDKQTIQLRGRARKANNESLLFLAPEEGNSIARYCHWIAMPIFVSAEGNQHFANMISNVDKAFAPALIRFFVKDISNKSRFEDHLGLYPKLAQIEARAELYKSIQIHRFMSPQDSLATIRQAFPEDMITQAAWGIALCEASDGSNEIGWQCWTSITAGDATFRQLLKLEITDLLVTYAALPSTHPLKVRLEKMSESL